MIRPSGRGTPLATNGRCPPFVGHHSLFMFGDIGWLPLFQDQTVVRAIDLLTLDFFRVAAAVEFGELNLAVRDDSGVDYAILSFEYISGCNPADLRPPFCQLDLVDVVAFTTGFLNGDLIADVDDNSFLDLMDVNLFVSAFTNGCD